MNPDLSVVICTYNRAAMLRRALLTTVQQETAGFTYEVVVVDDGSTDNTRAVVEELAADVPVRYVLEESRAGVATARNRGLKEARGRWIVFFDDDQLADPDWLVNLVAIAREHDAKVVGGALKLDLTGEALAALGPITRGILGANAFPSEPVILRGKFLPSTGNLLLARELFDAIGIFDPRMSSGEDADLMNRARAAGFDLWTAPKAVVAHIVPPYRLEMRYLRWVSLRWGNHFAYHDVKRGRLQLLLRCVARVGQAKLVHLPKLLWAKLTGNAAAAVDTKCLLWRAVGYARTTALILAPGLFPQKRFVTEMELRLERELFSQYAASQQELCNDQ